MILLSLEEACLLELVKSSIFESNSIMPKNVNWDKVFESAKAQGIVPLVASKVPEEYRDLWLAVSSQSKAHYMRLLYEQNLLVMLFNSNSIPYVIFKGTATAIYYPIPSLRIFGDIDFYVPEKYFDSAKSLLEHNNYTFLEKNDRHYEYNKNGITFELHNRISRQGVCDIDHIILNDMNDIVNCNINNYTFSCLPKYKNGLVLLWHLAHHLMTSGIGYRQIIDWMMFVINYLDDTSWEEHFKPLAQEAGLETLAVTVTFMCQKWMGLPKDISWCNKADEKVADQILIRVLEDGNFGKVRAPSENVRILIKKEGFFRFLQHAGIENWSVAQKHPFFIPFAWLYQLCRFAYKGIVGVLKGKKVFIKSKNKIRHEELLKKLEL